MSKITGVVITGKGEASRFTGLGWLQDIFITRFGFKPYPGTLNLRVAGAAALVKKHAPLVIDIEPALQGYCAAKAIPVKINDRLSAVWINPQVPDYPQDQIELIADCSLRDTLNLLDGDRVTIEVLGNRLP